MADIARILAEVVLQSKDAIAAWKQFSDSGVKAFQQIATASQVAATQSSSNVLRIGASLKAIGEEAVKLGEKVKRVGTAISIGISAPLALLGREAVKAFSESEQSAARLGAIFDNVGKKVGGSAEEMVTFAKATATQMPFASAAVVDMQAVLLKFTNVVGKEFLDARTAIVNFAAATGQDLASAAQQVGQALNDPISSLRALKEAGVTLTAEEKTQIASWVSLGQTAKAQDLIIKKFNQTFGESAQKIASLDSSKAIIQTNALNDAMEELGQTVLPIKITLVGFALDVVRAFNDLPEPIKNVAVVLGTIAVVLGPVLFIIGEFITVIGSLGAAFAFIAPAVAGVVAVISAFGAAFVTVVAAIGEVAVALAAAAGWPVLIAIALGAILVAVALNWEKIKAVFVEGVTAVGNILKNAWAGLGATFDIAIGLFEASWNLFWAFLTAGFSSAAAAITSILSALAAPIIAIINLAKEAFDWVVRAAAAAAAAPAAGGIGHKAHGGQAKGRRGIDKILTYLTNDEFVHRVAAVRKYGLGFMQSVNNLTFPKHMAQGFASGGLVGSPRMPFASAGQVSSAVATRGFTLVIGDQTFSGLRAPAETADDMVRYAHERQLRRTGRMPNWFR